MKEEHGGAFDRYLNGVGALFANAAGGADPDNPDGVMARVLAGRTADGKKIGDDPDVMRFLIGLAQELRPVETVIEAGSPSGQSIDAEIAEIKEKMRTDRRAYNKDEKLQARYRELIAARHRSQA